MCERGPRGKGLLYCTATGKWNNKSYESQHYWFFFFWNYILLRRYWNKIQSHMKDNSSPGITTMLRLKTSSSTSLLLLWTMIQHTCPDWYHKNLQPSHCQHLTAKENRGSSHISCRKHLLKWQQNNIIISKHQMQLKWKHGKPFVL